MAQRGGKGASTDGLRRGDLLSGTGAGQFDVQMAHHQGSGGGGTAAGAGGIKAWTGVERAKQRARERHNRAGVKPPDRCEALAYAMGLGRLPFDLVRSCAPRSNGGSNDGSGNHVNRTDTNAGCWTPLRWLCCGADAPLTLAQEHGFNHTAPRVKGAVGGAVQVDPVESS
jgi:hypothetical protein